MSFVTANNGPSSNDGPKCPKGRWPATCTKVEAMGDKEVTYDGKTKRQRRLMLVFDVTAKTDSCEVKRTYNWSMFKDADTGRMSDLRRDVEAWRGRPFESDDDAVNFDLSKVVHQAVTVQIEHNGEWVNITALAPAGMAEVKVEDIPF